MYVRVRMHLSLFVMPTDVAGSAMVRGAIVEHRIRRHGTIRACVYKTGFIHTRLDGPMSPTLWPNFAPSVLGLASISGAEPKRFGGVLGLFSNALGPDARAGFRRAQDGVPKTAWRCFIPDDSYPLEPTPWVAHGLARG